MKKEMIKLFIIPYMIYFLLYLVQKIKLPILNSAGANAFFVVLFIIYFICGIFLYKFIQSLEQNNNRLLVSVILLIHIIILGSVWFLVRIGFVQYISINTSFEVSAILLSIYVTKILSNFIYPIGKKTNHSTHSGPLTEDKSESVHQ